MTHDEKLDRLARETAAAFNPSMEQAVEAMRSALADFDWQPILALFRTAAVYFGLIDVYRTGWRLTGGPR